MPAGTLDELPPWAAQLLESERVAHLGLVDDEGRPRVLPVTFAVVDGCVWTAVDDKPKRRPDAELARVRWLRARRRASLTVDRYDDDWTRLAWVQVLGDADVVAIDFHPRVVDALARRYVPYRRATPPGPLLRLEPARVVSWRAAAD